MKVLVCGGREYMDLPRVYEILNEIHPTCVVHGGARGADTLADLWCTTSKYGKGTLVRRYPANWKKHGKAAGVIRNQEMLTKEKPDLVLAFPGGRGTLDMILRSRKAGIEIRQVTA